jgi:di/tricarboxylate transporter
MTAPQSVTIPRSGDHFKIRSHPLAIRQYQTPAVAQRLKDCGFFRYRFAESLRLRSGALNFRPVRRERAWVAVTVMGLMVVSVALGWLSMLKAAMLAAGLMILTRCTSGRVARRTVDWQVLMVIAASFGIGTAMEVTGAAQGVAGSLIGLAEGNPWATLALVYAVTSAFTNLVTNNAAAALMFPIALASAERLEVNIMPFAIAIMMAASASFATPIGYQTNLMVQGPGGYRFLDYVRVGVPLTVLTGAVTVVLTPFVWPFR